ncbi:MAG: hypothetical protein J5J06_07060 [Phycisphaerae bacterium]|nr:hypothetical protein [Phycisphaerae bacterium]
MQNRLAIFLVIFGAAWSVGCNTTRLAGASKVEEKETIDAAPPDADTSRRLLDLERQFQEKKRGSCITLSDHAFDDLREDARFRALIRNHVDTAESWMLPPDEPGQRLIVQGTIRNDIGQPVEDALVYAYQTDPNGIYSRLHGGNTASMGDALNPRIFAYVRTKDDGRYGLMTVRPGGYPGGGPPAHIHVEIEAPGHEPLVTEVMFADDLRMTPDTRERMERIGFVVCQPTKDQQGRHCCAADLEMKRTVSDAF